MYLGETMKKILYEEVALNLKSKILNGEYRINDYIPTEIELEEMFGVSKITVRKAIEILVQEGYLVKKSGKGTTVISNRTFNKLSKAESFSAVLESQGRKVARHVLSVTEISVNEIPVDVVSEAGKLIKLNRVYYLDEKPYIFFEQIVPWGANFEELRVNDTSLYAWLHRNNFEISQIKDSFSMDEGDDIVKNALRLDSGFVLKRTRISKDSSGRIIEFSIACYNTDIYPYEISYEV